MNEAASGWAPAAAETLANGADSLALGRACKRPGCDNPVPPSNDDFCSNACKYAVRRTIALPTRPRRGAEDVLPLTRFLVRRWQESGESERAFAKRMGIPPPTMTRLLKGGRPSPKTYRLLSLEFAEALPHIETQTERQREAHRRAINLPKVRKASKRRLGGTKSDAWRSKMSARMREVMTATPDRVATLRPGTPEGRAARAAGRALKEMIESRGGTYRFGKVDGARPTNDEIRRTAETIAERFGLAAGMVMDETVALAKRRGVWSNARRPRKDHVRELVLAAAGQVAYRHARDGVTETWTSFCVEVAERLVQEQQHGGIDWFPREWLSAESSSLLPGFRSNAAARVRGIGASELKAIYLQITGR